MAHPFTSDRFRRQQDRSRARRSALPRRALLMVALKTVVVAAVVCCAATSWGAPPGPLLNRVSLEITWGEWLQAWGIRAFAAAYCLCLGAMLGSFLNVVIYRMPRGRSLVRPGSCCPKCGAKIALRDNIPVLGWIKLGGRCRQCRAWIPARYPLVEAWIGVIWLVLGVLFLIYSGNHLPLRETLPTAAWLFWMRHWELPGLLIYHGILLTVLTAMALIKYDRQRLPGKLTLFLLLIGGLLPLVWPELHPVPAIVEPQPVQTAAHGALLMSARAPTIMQARWQGVLDTAAGAVAGMLLGGLLWMGNRRGAADWKPGEGLVISMVAVGLFLGWQAAVSIALLAALLRLLWILSFARLEWGRRVPPLAMVVAATCVQLPAWKLLGRWEYWPQPTSMPGAMFAAAAVTLAANLLTRVLTPGASASELAVAAEKFYTADELAMPSPRLSWADVLEPQRIRTLDV